jgi:hypothetical protein
MITNKGKKKKWTGELMRPIQVRVVRPKGLAVTDAETVLKQTRRWNG